MDKPRPHVTAALLCESVLQESNGTLSVVRIADKVGYDPTGMPEGFRPAFKISGLISLKAGPVVGDHNLKVVVENPQGKRTQIYELALKLMGRDQGQNLIVTLNLGIEHDGLHWFDVIFDDDEVLTRIPLMVMQEAAAAPTSKVPTP